MTLLASPATDRAIACSASPDVLAKVRDASCSLAIWERDAIAGAQMLVDGAQDSLPADIRFSAPIDRLHDQLVSEMEQAGFPAIPARDAVAADTAQLARRFAPIIGEDALEVRLECVTGDSCRKFHADYVALRLITTYVGTGTQWLDPEDAQRVAEGADPLHIHTLQPGDVGIFKGKLATEMPAIHRSPPIAGTGETRLLLVLNPPLER